MNSLQEKMSKIPAQERSKSARKRSAPPMIGIIHPQETKNPRLVMRSGLLGLSG
jgi:hypothetical protein